METPNVWVLSSFHPKVWKQPPPPQCSGFVLFSPRRFYRAELAATWTPRQQLTGRGSHVAAMSAPSLFSSLPLLPPFSLLPLFPSLLSSLPLPPPFSLLPSLFSSPPLLLLFSSPPLILLFSSPPLARPSRPSDHGACTLERILVNKIKLT